MKHGIHPRMIYLVLGLAVPDYMDFLLEYCEPIGYTRKAVDAGDLLLVDYHPPYLQLRCRDIEKVVEEARKRGAKSIQGQKPHHNNGRHIQSKNTPTPYNATAEELNATVETNYNGALHAYIYYEVPQEQLIPEGTTVEITIQPLSLTITFAVLE